MVFSTQNFQSFWTPLFQNFWTPFSGHYDFTYIFKSDIPPLSRNSYLAGWLIGRLCGHPGPLEIRFSAVFWGDFVNFHQNFTKNWIVDFFCQLYCPKFFFWITDILKKPKNDFEQIWWRKNSFIEFWKLSINLDFGAIFAFFFTAGFSHFVGTNVKNNFTPKNAPYAEQKFLHGDHNNHQILKIICFL